MVENEMAAVCGGRKNKTTWPVPSSNSNKLSGSLNDQKGDLQLLGLMYSICNACFKLVTFLKTWVFSGLLTEGMEPDKWPAAAWSIISTLLVEIH